MQPGGGMMQPPPMGMPPPTMDHQPPQQPQWSMMPPQQYYQAGPPMAHQHPPPMWNPQQSQVPPPVVPPAPQQQLPQQYPQPQYQAPMAPPPVAMPPPSQMQVHQPVATNEIRTLWIGDLPNWMDESYLYTIVGSLSGEVISLKIIRNKQTQLSDGYGFIEFVSRSAAERFLRTYNGQMISNLEQQFKLNWASSGSGEKRGDDGADYTIFVGDLAADVTDFLLQETFKNRYKSVKGAKVVTDKVTGRSKGYGFIRFTDEEEQQRAMVEMNGAFCSTRQMRIGAAANKKNLGGQQQYMTNAYQTTQGSEAENDPNNTTIFVGGLDPNVTDDNLRQVFSPYGEIVYVKIPVGKRCGFVQFANRANAEEALKTLHGTQLGAQIIRLSWGRSPTNKQQQQDQNQQQQDANQWNGGYYGYNQSYESYGYAQPTQDPNMYAYAAYQGYGNYQQQQPQPPNQ